MIYVLQLESLKERYTYWWEEYIPAEIKKAGKKYKLLGRKRPSFEKP